MDKQPRPHRKFYIEGHLEFALFFDLSVRDPDTIVKAFMESNAFRFSRFYKKKLEKFEISDDLMDVYLYLR